MTTCCKFDDGQSYPTNAKCFPARTSLRRRKEGTGHWLVAYRNTEEKNYRNLCRRIKESSSVSDTAGSTLDGPILLQLHCVDKPSELCFVDISDQNLNSVKLEDLKVFDSVAYIDACINFLSLGSFSSFTSLKELDLSLNGICNMTFDAADFPHLQVLNLSFNNLSADDIVSIGQLPCLKVLHLTGNRLHHLPPALGLSSHDATQQLPEGEDSQFRALEVLMLDDNKLSSGVFSSLTNLKRLKFLNLQGNCISEVPYLELMGWSTPAQESPEEQPKEEGLAHAKPDENLKLISEDFHGENWEDYSVSRSSLPLPELQFLSLANNKIADEDSLMAVALFPMLREIDIHSNPLTTRRSGDLPLLTYYLQKRLGITIKLKKTQDILRFPLKVSSDPKWKVEDRIPCESKKLPESKGKNSRDENTEHFFVTQATDVSKYEFDFQTAEKQTGVNREGKEDDSIPGKSACSKMLMDAKPKSAGIQTAVRMLEHTLKNLSVYRDSKPKLDSIQTPYRGREKRIKDLPPLKPMKHPSERVDEMIKEIKKSTTIKVVDLSSVIHGTDVNKQEYKEAVSLLRDMKTKYKMVHKKTMEQATKTNINEAQPPLVQML